jgi:hypothetical protein
VVRKEGPREWIGCWRSGVFPGTAKPGEWKPGAEPREPANMGRGGGAWGVRSFVVVNDNYFSP